MTDTEIIKALECCGQHRECCYCNSVEECGSKRVLVDNCLDLINRLQAENERLKGENIALNRRAIPSSGTILKVGNALLFAENEKDYDITINIIKAEAYKEFAEMLKDVVEWTEITVDDIDNLLKETVGEKDG